MKIRVLLIALLLTPISACAFLGLFNEPTTQKTRLINDSEYVISDVYLLWGKYGRVNGRSYLTPANWEHSGFWVKSLYVLPETISVHWTNAKGEKKNQVLPVKPETFPALKNDEEYEFQVHITQNNAFFKTVVPIPRRLWSKEKEERIDQIYTRFTARNRELILPYLDHARKDYADWENSKLTYHGSQYLDYQKGNEIVLLLVHNESGGPSAINGSGKSYPSTSRALAVLKHESRQAVLKGKHVTVDARYFPGFLKRREWDIKRNLEGVKGFNITIKETEFPTRIVSKAIEAMYRSGAVASDEELATFAQVKNWTISKESTGSVRYSDKNGVNRLLIRKVKGMPYAEIRNEENERIDPVETR